MQRDRCGGGVAEDVHSRGKALAKAAADGMWRLIGARGGLPKTHSPDEDSS